MRLRTCTYVKHKAQFRPQILADTLEEPSVRVNFSIISVLYGEHKVNTSPIEDILLKIKVPCTNLEHVDEVGRDILAALAHHISNVFHLPLAVPVFLHKPFILQNIYIKEILGCGKALKRAWNPIIAIAYHKHQQILLLKS